MKLTISRKILKELQEAAVEASPEECCGILFGQNGVVIEYELTRNVAANREIHFEIDPSALIAAERKAREGERSMLGYFHSHPSGSVEPSKTDAASASPDGRIWLIVNGKDASAWQSVENGKIFDRFDPISLECKDA